MLEILQNFEQAAVAFSPVVLIGPGLAALVIGLFIWLGGLGFRRVLAAAAGAISGYSVGFFLIGLSFNISLTVACAGAVIAVIFEKVFMVVLAAILAALITLTVLNARGALQTGSVQPRRTQTRDYRLDITSSLDVVHAYSEDAGRRIKNDWSNMPPVNWAVVAVAVLAVIAGGFLLWKLVSAFCCAALGTTLIFAGVILLLLFKGSAPLTAIYNKPVFYGATFAAMTVFGTVEQLVFCRTKKTAKKRKSPKKGSDDSEPKRQSWRNS